jgi:hypothetical protein
MLKRAAIPQTQGIAALFCFTVKRKQKYIFSNQALPDTLISECSAGLFLFPKIKTRESLPC